LSITGSGTNAWALDRHNDHAGVMRCSVKPALYDFLSQIRQPHIGAVALN
jgi:hypothetical protein